MTYRFVPLPPPHILKQCVYPLIERLRTMYLEKGEETNLSLPLKSQVEWYKSQGKNIVFAGSFNSNMYIIFQNDDGSYEAVFDVYTYNSPETNRGPFIRMKQITAQTPPLKYCPHTIYYYRAGQYHDFGLSFKVTGYDSQYFTLKDIFYKGLGVDLPKVLTKAHMEYMAHQSRGYMEEIWQKACHPTVVEKVIATYPSLEAFMNNPDAITPICILRKPQEKLKG